MGQAWCKEKTSKAQDSKSPLDRVFVRCAHRIYPSLKEEGSVLGGATQRVTSSEIGYAGSPPREVLTRGRSIDSVDRPFQPSDWVDVNLEVPSTPRPSSALTNLTVDTNLYPTTTPTSSCSNLKDATPIPPPRRRKRNKGRPLPPKPDEIAAENGAKRTETGDEPLYSSVRSPKSSGDEQDGEEDGGPGKHRPQEDGRRTKEIYEHKVNGTGRIISSDMVLGRRALEGGQRRGGEHEEYEKFARSRTSKDSSTPNREEKRGPRVAERQIKDPPAEAETPSGHARTKNYSTVSLPNYDELDAARHRPELDEDREQRRDKTRKSRRPVRSSTGSLPAETFLSPFSEKTSVRLEDYIPRCDILSPYQVLEKLDCGANGVLADDFLKYDPSKSEDWELGDIGNCELNHQRRLSFEETSRPTTEDVDTVDFSSNRDPGDRSSTDRDGSKSLVHLQKPDSFGKTPSPALDEPEYSEVDPNRSHTRYFDQPTLENNCGITCVQEQPRSQEPFFLDEAKHRSTLDTNPAEAGRADRSRVIFTRSLSNESEPNEDSYEPKELKNGSAILIKTISEESLPREMLEDQQLDDLFDAKHAKDAHNQLRKSLDDWRTSTPPPSPEPKIRPEILDADHSTLLKVLKDEAAEGSNLSSMTPSLTELEAALSDMLEREDSQDGSKEESKTIVVGERNVAGRPDIEISEHLDRSHSGDDHGDLVQDKLARKNGTPGCLKDALEDKRPSSGRKVSFCTWEESVAESAEPREDGKLIHSNFDPLEDVVFGDEGKGVVRTMSTAELPPEKPSRLNRSLDDLVDGANGVPTPPRRRNKSLGVAGDKKEVAQNGSVVVEAVTNDRLI